MQIDEAPGHQPPRDPTPVLLVQMRLQAGPDDAGVGQRLRGEEQHVGEEEDPERPGEGHPLATHIGERQFARMAQQHPEAAHQLAVDRDEALEGLPCEPSQ